MNKRWGDYRRTLERKESVAYYDGVVYAPGTFDSWVWEQEQRLLRELIPRLTQGKRASYLDFACGPGRIIGFVAPMVDRASGVDTSQAALEVAAKRTPGATFICGDVSQDPSLLGGPYDLITSFRFFLNAQPRLRDGVLPVLRRAIADDGYLVFNIHGNAKSVRALAHAVRTKVLRQEVNALSVDEVRAMLRRHGFEIVEIRGVSLLTPKLYRAAPASVRTWLQRRVERSRRLQRYCVDLVFVARPV